MLIKLVDILGKRCIMMATNAMPVYFIDNPYNNNFNALAKA